MYYIVGLVVLVSTGSLIYALVKTHYDGDDDDEDDSAGLSKEYTDYVCSIILANSTNTLSNGDHWVNIDVVISVNNVLHTLRCSTR